MELRSKYFLLISFLLFNSCSISHEFSHTEMCGTYSFDYRGLSWTGAFDQILLKENGYYVQTSGVVGQNPLVNSAAVSSFSSVEGRWTVIKNILMLEPATRKNTGESNQNEFQITVRSGVLKLICKADSAIVYIKEETNQQS